MKIISGNILDINSGIVMQQVNCQNVMGSGVAKALYQKYPIIKEAFHKLSHDREPEDLLGCIQKIKINDHLTMVNSFTQLNYGRSNFKYTDEELLIENIIVLDYWSMIFKQTAYVPYGIGCGLANGDWTVIQKALEETDIVVVKLEG